MHDQLWIMRLLTYLPGVIFIHADAQFRSSNLTARAEGVGDSTPGVRVTCSTTLPPDCMCDICEGGVQN